MNCRVALQCLFASLHRIREHPLLDVLSRKSRMTSGEFGSKSSDELVLLDRTIGIASAT